MWFSEALVDCSHWKLMDGAEGKLLGLDSVSLQVLFYFIFQLVCVACSHLKEEGKVSVNARA